MSKTPRPGPPASAGQPSGPSSASGPTPGSMSSVPPVPVPPRQIGWAVRLLQAAAVLQVLVTVLSILNISSADFRARTREALQEMGQSGMLDAVVDSAVKFSLVTAVVGGILAIAMYLVLATFIGKGALWARLAGGVVAIGALYQLTTLTMPAGIVTIVQMVAVLTAITLCYIKPASTFFREKQIAKLMAKRQ